MLASAVLPLPIAGLTILRPPANDLLQEMQRQTSHDMDCGIVAFNSGAGTANVIEIKCRTIVFVFAKQRPVL